LAQVSEPDVIIMDIRLAGNIDGIEASKEICKCYHCNIIFATGYSDDNIRSKAMSLKPLAYLIKPYQMKELISLVDIA
jgi:DNA-binding NarL/FixJ family response regulator